MHIVKTDVNWEFKLKLIKFCFVNKFVVRLIFFILVIYKWFVDLYKQID